MVQSVSLLHSLTKMFKKLRSENGLPRRFAPRKDKDFFTLPQVRDIRHCPCCLLMEQSASRNDPIHLCRIRTEAKDEGLPQKAAAL
ncbi:MAG: hypothetical protein ACI4PH_05315 [Faecousia sp.]